MIMSRLNRTFLRCRKLIWNSLRVILTFWFVQTMHSSCPWKSAEKTKWFYINQCWKVALNLSLLDRRFMLREWFLQLQPFRTLTLQIFSLRNLLAQICQDIAVHAKLVRNANLELPLCPQKKMQNLMWSAIIWSLMKKKRNGPLHTRSLKTHLSCKNIMVKPWLTWKVLSPLWLSKKDWKN